MGRGLPSSPTSFMSRGRRCDADHFAGSRSCCLCAHHTRGAWIISGCMAFSSGNHAHIPVPTHGSLQNVPLISSPLKQAPSHLFTSRYPTDWHVFTRLEATLKDADDGVQSLCSFHRPAKKTSQGPTALSTTAFFLLSIQWVLELRFLVGWLARHWSAASSILHPTLLALIHGPRGRDHHSATHRKETAERPKRKRSRLSK